MPTFHSVYSLNTTSTREVFLHRPLIAGNGLSPAIPLHSTTTSVPLNVIFPIVRLLPYFWTLLWLYIYHTSPTKAQTLKRKAQLKHIGFDTVESDHSPWNFLLPGLQCYYTFSLSMASQFSLSVNKFQNLRYLILLKTSRDLILLHIPFTFKSFPMYPVTSKY